MDQAAHAMGIKQQVANELVRSGLLTCAERDALGHRITLLHL